MTRTTQSTRGSHWAPHRPAVLDLLPLITVAVITVWAVATRNIAVAVPGAIIAAAMIAVTLTPGVTFTSLARRIRGLR